ncbi:hypothetical protein BSLG_000844 [Batrachochytrium salamandrivorans]|nr:hypothetical protein BSLG_000844 [Batrachochytrium salamandrivorans]
MLGLAPHVGDSPAASWPCPPKGKRTETPLVINAIDLKNLTQKLDGTQADKRLHQMLIQDREQRHTKSKARVANWDNTFAGQRRIRMAAREARLQGEEMARLEQDQLFSTEDATRREAAIQRAKKMQYFETDMVKAFHNRVMLLQVLEERDMQVQLKAERKHADSVENQIYYSEKLASLEAENKAAAKLQKDNKIRCIQLAKDQILQQRDKIVRDQANRKLVLEEGQRLVKEDSEYNQKQAEIKRKRQENAVVFNQQLHQLRKQEKDRDYRVRQQDEKEDLCIEAWVNRKANQAQLKKDLESKWHNDGIKARQILGKTQLKIINDYDAKMEEQINQRMVDRDTKAKKEEQDKLVRKKKNHDELRHFFQEYVHRAAALKQAQKEESLQTLQGYIRIRDEAHAEKEAKKASDLHTGKTLQGYHKKQIEQNAEMRAKDKTQRLADAIARKTVADAEDNALKEYMSRTKDETWAKKNMRIQAFIKDELARPCTAMRRPNSSRRGSNTANRLGLANNGYSKLELVRSNDIVTNDMLKLLGDNNMD